MPSSIRGGRPKVFQVTVPSSGVLMVPFLSGPSNYLQITTTANTTMYFNSLDSTNATNGLAINSTTGFSGPACVKRLYFAGAATVTIVAYIPV